jgi:hypothetical protein
MTSLINTGQQLYLTWLSGTSSLRRTAQLNRSYPELKVENIRGNLNTRLNKLDNGETYAAVVLASAGLSRMGWEKRISQVCIEMWTLIINVLTKFCRWYIFLLKFEYIKLTHILMQINDKLKHENCNTN